MNKGLQKLFSELSGTYDQLNRILTWRFDVGWRRRAAREACKAGGSRFLDICSGTGDMAMQVRRNAPPGALVVALDFCLPMLRVAVSKKRMAPVRFVVADAAALPFRDNTFDAATISFAMRNLTTQQRNLQPCLRDAARVLGPDGVLVNVETSQPSSPLLRRLFHAYVGLLVKPLGATISGSRIGYVYLSRTIPRFFTAERLAGEFASAGFGEVSYRKLLFGIAAVHCARK